MKIETLDSVESTNRYCELLNLDEVEEFTCYRAIEQTAGIGQRLLSTAEGTTTHNHWFSGAAGENLTISVILKPTFLPAANQFGLTQAVALAITDWLSGFNIQRSAKIKWPNDIYVGDRKICGILTTTKLSTLHYTISSAIVGIGLNVNQTNFPEWVPNPTSLALLTGGRHDVSAVLPPLLDAIGCRYKQLRHGEDLSTDYLERLMNLGVARRYSCRGEEITATVTGIDPFGRLCLIADDGRHLVCGMKEITLL